MFRRLVADGAGGRQASVQRVPHELAAHAHEKPATTAVVRFLAAFHVPEAMSLVERDERMAEAYLGWLDIYAALGGQTLCPTRIQLSVFTNGDPRAMLALAGSVRVLKPEAV